jgi:phosphate transport system substrate-binding protein
MGQIKQQPNTLGYTELTYALNAKLPVARLRNAAGKFVEPSLDRITAAAAETVSKMPADLRASIVNAAGETAYPISSYTYILVYKDQKDGGRGKALADFLWWALHDGEKFARDLQYAPLPPEVVKRAEEKVNSMTSGGKPLRGQ